MTVWLLYLRRPETFVCGPYRSEEAAVAAGHGRVTCEDVDPDRWIPVVDGLVARMDDVPTSSLRAEFSWYLMLQPVLLRDDGTGAYTDDELDARHPSLSFINEKLGLAGRKLVGL